MYFFGFSNHTTHVPGTKVHWSFTKNARITPFDKSHKDQFCPIHKPQVKEGNFEESQGIFAYSSIITICADSADRMTDILQSMRYLLKIENTYDYPSERTQFYIDLFLV